MDDVGCDSYCQIGLTNSQIPGEYPPWFIDSNTAPHLGHVYTFTNRLIIYCKIFDHNKKFCWPPFDTLLTKLLCFRRNIFLQPAISGRKQANYWCTRGYDCVASRHCTSMCLFRCLARVNSKLHTGQLCGFPPLCIIMCVFRCPDCVNTLLHPLLLQM